MFVFKEVLISEASRGYPSNQAKSGMKEAIIPLHEVKQVEVERKAGNHSTSRGQSS
jgi:hypothetical protein